MGIRGRLVLLVLGIVIALILLGTIDLFRVWQFNREQLADSLKKRTEIAAVAFEQWANAQQEPLGTLAEILEDKPIRSVIIQSNLLYLLQTRPHWINLQVVDERGNNLLKYSKGKEPPNSLIEDLLNKIKEKKNWVVTTDRTENEERPIFTIATPTKDGGAIIAQIDGEAVNELFKDIELAENSVVAIMDKDGRILYRRSADATMLYSEILGTSLIDSLGDQNTSVSEVESPYDGIKRIYGLARTHRQENVIIIGISSSRFNEPLWNQIYRQLRVSFIIAVIAIGVTLFLAFGIIKSLKELKTVTYRFATGNREVRAPENVAGEIGALGKAFNWMAEQLNEREERLKELDILKSEFVSSISHELKTPLTTIKTLAHVLKENKIKKAEKTEYLEVIAAECDRQIKLVSNLLDVSQIEADKFKFECSEVRLNEILQGVLKMEKPAAELKNNGLELQITDDVPAVRANSEALHRVFRSLVENAVKYTPEGGVIRISAKRSNGEVAVSVSDNGCGIGAEDLPNIFNKFYRGKPLSESLERVNEQNGVGLGLYITRKIVDQLSGRIEASSSLKGGTVLTVFLPVWKEATDGKTALDS